ncbi:AAA family ATPase [Pseudophaeobacter sp.]|uniref:ATP-binding protein n=1 Tax=Pseudophaeobacter sp. TaxID=1971739 RepID=UPI003296DD9A
MKLDFIEVSGFRGFRDKVRIEFGGGFTVISGRNGVGKSTICDAIEFALTGQIGKYAVENAAKENVSDYYWWRGTGKPDAHFVRIGFLNKNSERFIVTRTRGEYADKSDEEIVQALCSGDTPEDPIKQLVKTSILRDEWIAAQSLDLKETERFDLVRAAFGAIENSQLAEKAKSVVSTAEARVAQANDAYEEARGEQSRALVELSKASEAATQNSDIDAAIRTLGSVFRVENSSSISELREAARQRLPALRERQGAFQNAISLGHEIEALRAEYESGQKVENRQRLSDRRETALDQLERATAQLEDALRKLEMEQAASDVAASLSALLEHGLHVGLDEGHCPLCAASRTDDDFSVGVEKLSSRIDKLASGINAAREQAGEARSIEAEARVTWEKIEGEWAAEIRAEESIRSLEEKQVEMFERYVLPLEQISSADELATIALQERNQLVEVERALSALEASRAVDRLTSVSARVGDLRRLVDNAADQLAECQSALSLAKALDKNVRRSASEIIDERLALVSPLLNELYQRLRPHSDWRSIEYSIRGDVRRFLSLKVGNELNPQFVFSSGQRRAAGIAFLLSVHLARSWSQWETLVLDDPVQHVDDFRALNLVEVLSAMRQGGRQIICAVEDEALAELICRRLLRTSEENGLHHKIDVDAQSSGSVVETTQIPDLPNSVLRRASDQFHSA